jgi:hypothetical protein
MLNSIWTGNEKENESIKTKMDVFASKTGTITKFIDTHPI